MDAPVFENLDLACAKAGKEIATKPSKELEKIITHALGVVEEQGVYALFLFLKNQKHAEKISQELHEFLKKTPRQTPLLPANTDIFPSIRTMAEDIDKLLLAHSLLRQAFVYARYHARLSEGEVNS